MEISTLTAVELARHAGYTIRPMDSGGLEIREELRLMSVGPHADELDILRAAHRRLAGPAKIRPIAELAKRRRSA